MGVWTRIIVAIVVTCIPVGGAWAIGGKFERRACGQEDGDTAAVTTAGTADPGRASPSEIDWTAVEMLRNADAADLNDAQMASLFREVARLRAQEAKVGSDGTISDADRAGLARAAYYSCQKIMTPENVRRTATFSGVFTGTTRQSRR